MSKVIPKLRAKRTAAAPSDPLAGMDAIDAIASPHTPAFAVGERVHHPKFGSGKVESVRDDKVTIRFKKNVTKEIRQDFLTRN